MKRSEFDAWWAALTPTEREERTQAAKDASAAMQPALSRDVLMVAMELRNEDEAEQNAQRTISRRRNEELQAKRRSYGVTDADVERAIVEVARKYRKVTKAAVAERLGFSESGLRDWLKARNKRWIDLKKYIFDGTTVPSDRP